MCGCIKETATEYIQYSCTLGGAFEARVHPCTLGYNEAFMATVVILTKLILTRKTFPASIQRTVLASSPGHSQRSWLC